MSVPSWFRHEVGVGDIGDDVVIIHRILGAPSTDHFDDEDAALVRGRQHRAGLPVTGVVDSRTAELLGERADAGLVPLWFTRNLREGARGDDVAALRAVLGLSASVVYDHALALAVRRYRSANRLFPLSDLVDRDLAVAIGDTPR